MAKQHPMDMEQTFEAIAEFEPETKIMQRDLASLRHRLTAPAVQPEPKSIWRTIMTNKWTHLSAAAMLLIGVTLAFTFLTGSQLSAAELLTKVAHNLDQLTWIKRTSYRYLPDQNEPASHRVAWLDMPNKRAFVVYDDTYIHLMDYQNWEWSIYTPQNNTTTIKELHGTWTGPGSDIQAHLDKIQAEGLKVTQTTQKDATEPITIVRYTETLNDLGFEKMTNTRMGGQPVKTIDHEIVIRQRDLLPERTVTTYRNYDGQIIVTDRSQAEYVDSGPQDLYELGVPSDAEVVNKVPAPEVKRIKANIEKCKQAFLRRYTAVITESDLETDDSEENMMEAMVVFLDEEKLRVDVYGNRYGTPDSITPQFESELAASNALLETYWQDNTGPGIRSVRLYDGLWQYVIDRVDEEFKAMEPQRRPDGDLYGDDDIDDMAWKVLRYSSEPTQLKQDTYATEHHLLLLECASQGKDFMIAQRQRLYVDPNRDYLTHRYVREALIDAPWQENPNWRDEEKTKDYPFREEIHDQVVTEYGQTSEGLWYPKTIEVTGFDRHVGDPQYDVHRIIRIHLVEEYPQFPAGLFDPNHLPVPAAPTP